MGNTIREYLKENKIQINPLFIFLKNFLSNEKIQLLKYMNEDNLIDQDFFCDFFLTNVHYFNLIKCKNNFVNFFELMSIIYLIKNDHYKTKLSNLFSLFNFAEDSKYISQDKFTFMYTTFLESVKKLYSITDFDKDKNFNEKLNNEIHCYIVSIFKTEKIKEARYRNMVNLLENDDALYNLMLLIQQQSNELLGE